MAVTADPEAVEAIAEILAREAPGGVSIEAGLELRDGGLPALSDPGRPARVRAWLPGASSQVTADAVTRVRAALAHLQAFQLRPIGELQAAVVREADWAAQGRAHFPVLRVGERFVIRPRWRRYRRQPGDVVLVLDPGLAFGTGLHPTTRLCLVGLEAWHAEGAGAVGTTPPTGDRLAGARVLDVGSGSGILALAAARLGAASVLAVDTDALAVEATRANARRNRLSRRIVARQGSVPTGEPCFDLVLANLVASILVSLAAGLYAEVRSGEGVPGTGGRLLASGIIADREAEVRRALAAAGFHLLRRWEEGDWVALEAERVV
ncbi:MAG: 50S ribosomal protein L11 methyltransferase [Candidatus Limnocylindrales bacterium]